MGLSYASLHLSPDDTVKSKLVVCGEGERYYIDIEAGTAQLTLFFGQEQRTTIALELHALAHALWNATCHPGGLDTERPER